MANTSKNKGNYGERRWAKLLMEFTGREFRKTPNSGGYNKTGGVVIAEHKFCGDVICNDPKFIFCFESKNRPNDFQPALLATNPGPAAFSTWWYETCDDAKRVDLLPLLGFKLGASSNKDVGNDFIATTQSILNHIRYPYNSPKIIIDSYKTSVYVNIRVGKKVEKRLVILPIPHLVSWRRVVENCDPEKFFDVENVVFPDWEDNKLIVEE